MKLENISIDGEGEDQAIILDDLRALPEDTITGFSGYAEIYARRIEGRTAIVNQGRPDQRDSLQVHLNIEMKPVFVNGDRFNFDYGKRLYSVNGTSKIFFPS